MFWPPEGFTTSCSSTRIHAFSYTVRDDSVVHGFVRSSIKSFLGAPGLPGRQMTTLRLGAGGSPMISPPRREMVTDTILARLRIRRVQSVAYFRPASRFVQLTAGIMTGPHHEEDAWYENSTWPRRGRRMRRIRAAVRMHDHRCLHARGARCPRPAPGRH